MGCSASGGIKGGNTTFQQSLDAGYVPKSSSLACNSLFSKYIFNLIKNETNELVDLSLHLSQSKDPLTDQLEKFLSIGLLSSEDGKNHRDPLNLIIVLDVSGSMSEHLGGGEVTKLHLAKDCVKNIYKKLNEDERLGLLIFNTKSEVILNLQTKKDIDQNKFFERLDQLKAEGGTSIEVGYHPAVSLMKEQMAKDYVTKSSSIPQNQRIIFITDALITDPNESDALYNINFSASTKPDNIFTTFIGVGIDFNTDLVARLTKIRGSNYFAVHSNEEFVKTLEEDFNYIVTPICFEVYVKVESSRFEIERTYGSEFDFIGDEVLDSQKQMKKGGVIRLETLLAYEKCTGGIKGGVVLVKLKEKNEKNDEIQEDNKIFVTLEYEDLYGNKTCKKMEIEKKFVDQHDEYASTGVRKALCLSRYVTFMKNLIEEKKEQVKLDIRKEKFVTYFKEEIEILKDKQLEEEYDNLNKMIKMFDIQK